MNTKSLCRSAAGASGSSRPPQLPNSAPPAGWAGLSPPFARRSWRQPSRDVNLENFETFLRCPDCRNSLTRDDDTLRCVSCGYSSPCEAEVYNLLPSAERRELYPGDRNDIIDFSVPGHEQHLLGDWYELEGIHGNKYRWIGASAAARLARVKPGPQRLRIRGHASPPVIPGEVRAIVNGAPAGSWKLDRPGVFILEADLPDPELPRIHVEIQASPTWTDPADDRTFSVNLSMIRLIDAEE